MSDNKNPKLTKNKDFLTFLCYNGITKKILQHRIKKKGSAL